MPQREEVYTISDDEILESMRRKLERSGAMRSDPGSVTDGASRTARQKVRYTQPTSGGTRALWASTLSLFVCGAGQVYNGQGKLGALLFLTEALVVAMNWFVMQLWSSLKELADVFGVTDMQIFLTVALTNFLVLFLAMISIHQAYREAEREHGPYGGTDNPLYSVMASLMVPGWGQLCNGQPGKAVTFLFCVLSGIYTYALMTLTPILTMLEEVPAWRALATQLSSAAIIVLAVTGGVWFLSIYDAMLVTGFRRRMF